MKKIEFASATNTLDLEAEVDTVLRAIAKLMIEPGESVDDWMR